MKKILSLLLFTVLLSSLFGCMGATEKVFEKSGMSITLSTDFIEKDHISYTCIYDSKNIAVYTLKEEFSMLNVDSEYLLDDYAELVILANQLEDSEVMHKDNLTYFTYEKSANGKDVSFYAFVFKGNDAFWLIQFACEQKNTDKLEQDIFKYASTVTIK